MKIYFSLSIRGGREHEGYYGEVLKLLKEYGDVLNEHIASKDPELKEVGLTDINIYQRDIAWIKDADVIVAEVTVPSTGVGYEIAYAEMQGKKMICIYHGNAEKRLSGMISGNENLNVKIYNTVEDLKEIFKEFFK